MPLSTAAKAALCICPPALMAGTVATVPPVKRAVHHLTAPRHAPKPIRRLATASSLPPAVVAPQQADCDPGPGGNLPAVPLVTYAAPLPDEPVGGFTPGGGVSLPAAIGIVGGGVGGGGGGGGTPVVPTTPVDPGAGPVPEPSAWLMMIVGVGTLGAALRRRRERMGLRPGTIPPPGARGTARRATAGGLLWSGSAAVEAGDMAATVALKSAVASAAGKAMLCVCPAAIVAGSVMTVPPLRQAVYAATTTPRTAPSLAALPAPVAAPPCLGSTVPVAATAVEGFPATVATTPAPMQAAAAAPASRAPLAAASTASPDATAG